MSQELNKARQLLNAVEKNNLNAVKKLIEDGAEINAFGRLPLYTATKNNFTEIAEYLIDKGARVGAIPDKEEKAPIVLAAKNGNNKLIKALHKAGANLNPMRQRTLISAIQNNQLDSIKLLIDLGVDHKTYHEIALRTACKENKYEIAKYFLEKGSDPNKFNNSAIKNAVRSNNPDMIKLLIKHNATYKKVMSILLDDAALDNHVEALKTLIDICNPTTKEKNNALFTAVEHGNSESADLLLKNGAEIKKFLPEDIVFSNLKNEELIETLKVLIDHGFDIHSSNDYILLVATRLHRLSLVEFLLEKGADSINADIPMISIRPFTNEERFTLSKHGTSHLNLPENDAIEKLKDLIENNIKELNELEKKVVNKLAFIEYKKLTIEKLRENITENMNLFQAICRYDDINLIPENILIELKPDDFLKKDCNNYTPIYLMGQRDQLNKLFKPSIWAGRTKEMMKILNKTPLEFKEQIDFKRLIGTTRHVTNVNNIKKRNIKKISGFK